jgi:hypothetical protein
MLLLLRPLTLLTECFPFRVNLFSILGLHAIVGSFPERFKTMAESGR